MCNLMLKLAHTPTYTYNGYNNDNEYYFNKHKYIQSGFTIRIVRHNN